MSDNKKPEMAFIQKPIHITGKNFSIGARGMLRAMPRILKSMATLVPTRKLKPNVWTVITVGYASSESDS